MHANTAQQLEQTKMTKAEFNLYEIKWATDLLNQTAYTMPDGVNSHDMAREVLKNAESRMILENPIRINYETGLWEFCA